MSRWMKLLFCFLAVYGFIIIIPLFLNKIKSYRDVIENSESLEIDNSALFYSEEALTSSAELELRERLNSDQE